MAAPTLATGGADGADMPFSRAPDWSPTASSLAPSREGTALSPHAMSVAAAMKANVLIEGVSMSL
jgi:hypothetical protein